MKVIIAAAGTGGHINPGIAIANKIMYEEPDSKIIFIGTNRGLENDLVPRAGYELKTIQSYGISRSLTLKNIQRLCKTIQSIKEAEKIIQEFKPDIIIGTGGYICVSVCRAAQKQKVPYIIHESNVLPGVATKLIAKKAVKILVGFKEAKQRLPKGVNVITTGTPTKVKNLHFSREQIKQKKKQMGFEENKPLVLVFGGSQGAESINNSIVKIIKEKKNKDYQIIWAAGPYQYKVVKEELAREKIDIENIDGIKAVPYIYNMEEVMNIADLVVCRSGAMTVTEIEKVGKPAIFIPFPYAAENHQEYNARILEKAGAAKVILDKELTADKLHGTIETIVKEEGKLTKMGEESQNLSINNVEENIYKEIISAIKI